MIVSAMLIGVCVGLAVYVRNRLLPTLQMSRRNRKRLLFEMPGAIEVLAMAMESGLSFREAMHYLVKHHHGILSDLFARAQLEMEAGSSLSVALTAAADRTQSNELRLLIRTLIQTERQGISARDVLLDIAQSTRERQKHEIAAEANKLPTTMLVPIFIFIVPPVLLLYVLPALVNIQHVM